VIRIREVAKYRYLFAAVLTLVVFMFGMLFSNFMDTQRSASLQNEVNNNMVNIESQQLQLSYLQSGDVRSCEAMQAGVESIVRDYNSRLNQVQQYQDRTFFQEQRFETIRKRYVISGIRYWLFVNELKENCDMNANTVLFFTKNLENEECDGCEYVGRQLELLKNQYGESVLIFSVPMDMDDGMVDVLEQQYNISEAPAVVINQNNTLRGSYSKTELEREIFQ
jgi:hypothetical protein